MDDGNPRTQAARQIRKTRFSSRRLRDANILNAREKLEIPQGHAMPYVTQTRICTAKAPTEKVAVPKEGVEETLAFSEWRMATLSSRKRAWKIKAFGTQRCIFTKSEINRMQLMLQIEVSFTAS